MDLETAYESPLELLLNYYLKLIEVCSGYLNTSHCLVNLSLIHWPTAIE